MASRNKNCYERWAICFTAAMGNISWETGWAFFVLLHVQSVSVLLYTICNLTSTHLPLKGEVKDLELCDVLFDLG